MHSRVYFSLVLTKKKEPVGKNGPVLINWWQATSMPLNIEAWWLSSSWKDTTVNIFKVSQFFMNGDLLMGTFSLKGVINLSYWAYEMKMNLGMFIVNSLTQPTLWSFTHSLSSHDLTPQILWRSDVLIANSPTNCGRTYKHVGKTNPENTHKILHNYTNGGETTDCSMFWAPSNQNHTVEPEIGHSSMSQVNINLFLSPWHHETSLIWTNDLVTRVSLVERFHCITITVFSFSGVIDR